MKEQSNRYDYVDLDLPSGTLWATMNVGAKNPWEYGKYFAWGDTEGYYDNEEHDFSWKNYKWRNDDDNGDHNITLTKYNNDSSYGAIDNKLVLDQEDDAVHVHMGGNCRMPTDDEIQELVDYTDNEWIEDYKGTGINGNLFTSKKDSSKSIFIPASGGRWDSHVYLQGSNAYLWSSTLFTDSPNGAWTLNFRSGHCLIYYYYRYGGYCVRGVKEKKEE